jgi:hypothetical protein
VQEDGQRGGVGGKDHDLCCVKTVSSPCRDW